MSIFKKYLKVTAVVALSLGLLSACGGTKKDSKATDGTISFAKENDVVSMNTAYATDGMSFEIIAATTEGLMSVDKDGNPIEAIAEKYEVSEDGLTYTFTLRDSTWDNGEKVSANDFVFAWQETLTNPAAEYSYLFTEDGAAILNAADVMSGAKDKSELGVTAVDDKTLEIKLSAPRGYFLSLMSFPIFYPINEKFYTEKGDQYALVPENLLSNGPFKMATWETDSKIVLEKNEKYWDAKNVNADKLVFNILPDASSRVISFEAGENDFIKLNSDLVEKYKDNESYNSYLEGYLWFLQYNVSNKYLANENFRMALSLATDKAQVADGVLKDGSIAAQGFVPKSLAVGPDGKDYRETADSYQATDKEEAKKYWAKAKKELGFETVNLKLLVENSDPAKPAAEYLQSDIAQTLEGLTFELVIQTKKNRIEMQKQGDFDVVLTRWGPDYADPTTYLFLLYTGNAYNYGKFSSKDYDALINKAVKETDAGKRWQLLKDAEKIILEDGAITPVFQTGGASLVNTKVSGLETHTVGVPFIYKNVKKDK